MRLGDRRVLCSFFAFFVVAASLSAQERCDPRRGDEDCPNQDCRHTRNSVFLECNPIGRLAGCDDVEDLERIECSLSCSAESLPIFECTIIACEENRACFNGGVCAFGLCAECGRDGDCPRGQRCIDLQCIDPPRNSCRRSDECPRGFRCTGGGPQTLGRCEQYDGPCSVQHDCPANFWCLGAFPFRGNAGAGVCVQLAAERCERDEDCHAALICAYGRCGIPEPQPSLSGPEAEERCLPNPLCPETTKCGGKRGIGFCKQPDP